MKKGRYHCILLHLKLRSVLFYKYGVEYAEYIPQISFAKTWGGTDKLYTTHTKKPDLTPSLLKGDFTLQAVREAWRNCYFWRKYSMILASSKAILSSKTFYDDGNALQLHGPFWLALTTCGCPTLKMWLVHQGPTF